MMLCVLYISCKQLTLMVVVVVVVIRKWLLSVIVHVCRAQLLLNFWSKVMLEYVCVCTYVCVCLHERRCDVRPSQRHVPTDIPRPSLVTHNSLK